MKISIVTISFNQAAFLERTIRSVVEQDYADLEYIVVDPGSTDGSRDIIERYRSRTAKVIYEPDRGAADGLNHGFAHATGDILGYLNSDDVFLPGTLKRIEAFFAGHPKIDVVSGNALVIDGEDKLLRVIYSDAFSLTMSAYGASVQVQPSTFFRRQAFLKTPGFNVANRTSWDGELFEYLSRAGARFAVVNEIWSGFRIHPGGISGSGRLAAEYEDDLRRRFVRIMGRERRVTDHFLERILRGVKHLRHPAALFDRIRYKVVSRPGPALRLTIAP